MKEDIKEERVCKNKKKKSERMKFVNISKKKLRFKVKGGKNYNE